MVYFKQVISSYCLAVIASCLAQTTEVAKTDGTYNAGAYTAGTAYNSGAYNPAYNPYTQSAYDYSGYPGYTGTTNYGATGAAAAYKYPYSATTTYNSDYCRRYPTAAQCVGYKGYPYQDTTYTGRYNAYNTGAYNPYNPTAYTSGAYNPSTYNAAAYNPAYNTGAYKAGAYNPAYNTGAYKAAAYNPYNPTAYNAATASGYYNPATYTAGQYYPQKFGAQTTAAPAAYNAAAYRQY